MLSVEEALENLAELALENMYGAGLGTVATFKFNKWDQEFILDMQIHVHDKRPISTAQGEIVLKLIKQHRDALASKGITADAIDALLLTPHYRIAPYQSQILPREVRWAGGNRLAFRCKFNSSIIEAIKRLRASNPLGHNDSAPMFIKEVKLWIVTVSLENMNDVMQVIQRHKFGFDSEVENLFLRIANSKATRGAIDLVEGQLVLDVASDAFMDAWAKATLRLDGHDV